MELTAPELIALPSGPGESSDAKRNKWIFAGLHLLVGACLVVAAAKLRFGELGQGCLWLDDSWVALVGKMSATQMVQVGMTAFGFNALLWAWLHLVGFSELNAQLVPFLAGCLAPAAIYWLAIRRRLHMGAALAAAVLLVVAPMHIRYSVTVKQYTLEALLSIVLSGCAWAFLEAPSRKHLLALETACAIAVMISSLTVFVVLPIILLPALWAALGRSTRRAEFLTVPLITFALTVGWVLVMASDAAHPSLLRFWSDKFVGHAGADSIARNSLRLVRLFLEGLTCRKFVFAVFGLTAATFLAARTRPILTATLCCPFLLLFAASVADRAPFGGGRTDVFLYPLAALVIALGVDESIRLLKENWFSPTWAWSASLLVAGPVLALEARGAQPARPFHGDEDLAPVANYVKAEKRSGDLIVLSPFAKYSWFLYFEQPFEIPPRKARPLSFPYTVEAENTIVLDEFEDARPEAYADGLDRELAKEKRTPPRIWLVICHTGYGHDQFIGVVEKYLGYSGYTFGRKEARQGAFVELWIRAPDGNP